MIWIYRTFLISFCLLIACLSLSLRLGGVGPSDFIDASPTQMPASWQMAHSDTYTQLSMEALQQGDLQAAKRLGLQALSHNISSGNAASQLMRVYEKAGDLEQADQLADLAEQLWPAHFIIRARLADYWTKRDNLLKVVPEWNVLMIHDRQLRKQLYPALQNIANNPDISAILQPYIASPPNWWNGFFRHMALKNDNLETIRALYQARVDSDVPLDDTERRFYVRRLLKEKMWDEAYFAWLAGLDNDQLTLSGLVFDGGFESDLHNTGFDWRFGRGKNINIETRSTIGMSGRRALRIALDNKKRINFRHVQQRLNLSPGSYNLDFRYRVNRLQTEEGLRWRIRCLPNSKQVLGESDLIARRTPWIDMETTQFTVPAENCPAQLLRLEASSRYKHKWLFDGVIWIDEIKISRDIEEE